MAKYSFYYGRYDEAQGYLRQALKIYPQSPDYSIFGAIDILKNDNTKALQDLNTGYKLNGNDSQLLYLSGICMLLLQDPSTAYNCFIASEGGSPDEATDAVISRFFTVD